MNAQEPIQPDPRDEQAYRVAYLIAGYLKETLTQIEHQELDTWVTASMDNQRLFEELTDEKNLAKWLEWRKNLPVSQIVDRLKSKLVFTPEPSRSKLVKGGPYLAAACVIILLLGIWWIGAKKFSHNRAQESSPGKLVNGDIAPGANRATLVLADGTIRQLDSAGKGMVAAQGGALVIKGDSDRLIYQSGSSDPAAAVVFNTLRVPRGGQYQLRLSDGTKVWLNADSYLKYPTAFAGKERKVELAGEGYFEVAEDPHHPFIVQAEGVVTQVLGTRFDINTYPETKTIQITLAEGAVNVLPATFIGKQPAQSLRPGQQAQVERTGGRIKIISANLQTVLAWKDGLFAFQGTPLEEVLAQISRWYNVPIRNETTDTNHFNASIPREVPVSTLIHMLEQTKQVHFRIEPNRITATN